MSERQHWVMKTEPDVYSFDDLQEQPDATDHWDGIRNYQARNFMQEMREGDLVIIYHSNTKPPHAAGVARVATEAYPDHTAWDPDSDYHDPKSTEDDPRWFMVDVQAIAPLPTKVPLAGMKENDALSEMHLVQRFNRLSVMPATRDQFAEILRMGDAGEDTTLSKLLDDT